MSTPQMRTPGCNLASADQTKQSSGIVGVGACRGKSRARLSVDDAHDRLRFCDSYSRIGTLIELGFEMAADDWHAVIGEEWSMCDNIGSYRTLLRKMLPATGPVLPMMDAAERAAYDALPERITVYRGCGAANMRGASWSLDRDVAARFPLLMRYRAAQPLLITASVRKNKVLAVKLDRNEAEIITFAARMTTMEALASQVRSAA